MKIGIIGCGVIGNALKVWLENNTSHELKIKDPKLNLNDDITDCNIVFIQIHLLTGKDGLQDLTVMEQIIEDCPDVPIFIRTTLQPTACEFLRMKTNKDINHMPEFLRERNAVEDFTKQDMIFTNHIDLLKQVFPNKKYVEMSSEEAEMAKYTHNIMGALKVIYYNGVYEYCEKMGFNFEKVRQGSLVSKFIHEDWTNVPGFDGLFGYGGKCFPKDVKALIGSTEGTKFNELVRIINKLNLEYRGVSEDEQ